MHNRTQKSNQVPFLLDYFLVCGLGSLGQNCLVALKKFGVKVIAIELQQPTTWEIRNGPQLLDDLIIGDCREELILEQARVKRCRSVISHKENHVIRVCLTQPVKVNVRQCLVLSLVKP